MDQSTKKSMMKAAIIHLEREKSSSIFFLTKGMSKSSPKVICQDFRTIRVGLSLWLLMLKLSLAPVNNAKAKSNHRAE